MDRRRFRGRNQRYKKKAMRERATVSPHGAAKGQVSKKIRNSIRKGGKVGTTVKKKKMGEVGDEKRGEEEGGEEEKVVKEEGGLSPPCVTTMKKWMVEYHLYPQKVEWEDYDENAPKEQWRTEAVDDGEEATEDGKELGCERPEWSDFRAGRLHKLEAVNPEVAAELETFMKTDEEEQEKIMKQHHPDLVKFIQQQCLLDDERARDMKMLIEHDKEQEATNAANAAQKLAGECLSSRVSPSHPSGTPPMLCSLAHVAGSTAL